MMLQAFPLVRVWKKRRGEIGPMPVGGLGRRGHGVSPTPKRVEQSAPAITDREWIHDLLLWSLPVAVAVTDAMCEPTVASVEWISTLTHWNDLINLSPPVVRYATRATITLASRPMLAPLDGECLVYWTPATSTLFDRDSTDGFFGQYLGTYLVTSAAVSPAWVACHCSLAPTSAFPPLSRYQATQGPRRVVP